jgi:hypothetical protein
MIYTLLMAIGGMETIVLYLLLCFLVAWFIGRKRNMGFGFSFLMCILFSPLIGLIITLFSKKIA